MRNLMLEERQFDEVKLILMRFDVVDDFKVDLLKNDVQFIKNLTFDLKEYILT